MSTHLQIVMPPAGANASVASCPSADGVGGDVLQGLLHLPKQAYLPSISGSRRSISFGPAFSRPLFDNPVLVAPASVLRGWRGPAVVLGEAVDGAADTNCARLDCELREGTEHVPS